MLLIQAIEEFNENPAQLAAIGWLQQSTGILKQQEFALRWRNSETNDQPISFGDVFRHYKGEKHQVAAIKWLEQNSHPRTMAEFLRQYGKALFANNILLNVPYYPQRDNQEQPMRTCNTSSHAMLVSFLKPGLIKGDDDYFQRFVKGRFDTTDWGGHTTALEKLGIKSFFSTALDYGDIDAALRRGFPVPIGVLHRGTLASPAGGHVVLVVGKRNDTDYICHDPFGAGFGAYTNPDGKNVSYPKASLNFRWLTGWVAKTGWGRIVTEVR